MAEKSVILHVDGPSVYGDLTVSGFATDRTAEEVGIDFAAVLKRRWPEATVTARLAVALVDTPSSDG